MRPEIVDAVYARTEGNALFLVELTQLLARSADGEGAGVLGVPDSDRTAIRERLAELPDDTRAALEQGAARGREFRTAAVAVPFDRDPVELAAAVEAAIVAPVAPGQFRFAHNRYVAVRWT